MAMLHAWQHGLHLVQLLVMMLVEAFFFFLAASLLMA
jgi:hypothetical protein